MRIRSDPADPKPLSQARVGCVMLRAADEVSAFDALRGGGRRSIRLGAGAGDQCAALDRRLDPFGDLRIACHGVDHHQRVVVHLKTMGRRRIAVGQVLVDQKKSQRIVAVEAEAETAAPFAEIGEQPALVIKIANVFDRCFEGRVVLRRPRRDMFFDQWLTRSISCRWSWVKLKSTCLVPYRRTAIAEKLFVQLFDETGFVQFGDEGIVDKLLGLGGFAGGIHRKIQHRLHARR